MQIVGAPGSAAAYKGMLQGTYRIASTEGILSLWRGMSSVVVGAGTPCAGPSSRTRRIEGRFFLRVLTDVMSSFIQARHTPSTLPPTRP